MTSRTNSRSGKLSDCDEKVVSRIDGSTQEEKIEEADSFEPSNIDSTDAPDAPALTVSQRATPRTEEKKHPPSYFESLLPDKYKMHEMRFAIGVGNLLSFNAGFLNGFCLSGLVSSTGDEVSVAGFTGAYTNSALELVQFEISKFAFLVAMIASMTAGAGIAGFMTPKATAFHIQPTYGPTFLIGGFLLLIGSLMAAHEVGGNYVFCFVAAANGTQNGVTSLFSANLIRTTHLTGTTTDIGLFLGQIIRGNKENLWKLCVLSSLTTTFWLGGIAAYEVAYHVTVNALLISMALHFCIGIITIIFVVYELHVSIPAAIFGNWAWENVMDSLADHLASSTEGGARMSKSEMLKSSRLRSFFDDIADDEEEIDASTLYEEFEKRGIQITRKKAKILVKSADIDGDGTIDKEEFVRMAKVTQERKKPKEST